MSWNHQETLANLRNGEIESLFDFLEETQFWIKDENARYLRVNRAFHLNYSLARPEDVVGLTPNRGRMRRSPGSRDCP
jgi:hypothetical protein